MVTHQTINGRIEFRRTVYWSTSHGSEAPLDRWLGIDRHRFSPGVREICCRESLHCSFEVASDNVARLAQLSLSGRTVRRIVEAEGQNVQGAQRRGELLPAFDASNCTGGVMVTGTDGVLVPLVTESQKAKRRKTEAIQRSKEGRRSTRKPGRPRKGSDGDYKEFKVLSFYDPDKSHCHVVATAGDCGVLGRLMRREAGRLRLDQATAKYAVTDGAEWIARQYQKQLPMLDQHILDYYHLRSHVRDAGHTVYGEGTEKSVAWRELMMGLVWEQGSLVMLHRLGAYIRRHKGQKREALESLRNYVGKRIVMTDYPAFREQGYDCGSGPTESLCGTLTDRLKGSGMRWDRDNAESMMALGGICRSNLWHAYWKSQRAA